LPVVHTRCASAAESEYDHVTFPFGYAQPPVRPST
jgi:hypothetical protein